MKHRALPIKQWIISELTAKAWSMIIVRALPELTQHNENFNCFSITRRTRWDEMEVGIIQQYLFSFFHTTIPDEVLSKSSVSQRISNWLFGKQ